MNLPPLTKKQAQILLYLVKVTKDRGYQPTIREIARRFKIASPNGVHCHIKALRKKGYIGKSRGARSIDIGKALAASDL